MPRKNLKPKKQARRACPAKPEPCLTCRDTGYCINLHQRIDGESVIGQLVPPLKPFMIIVICQCPAGDLLILRRHVAIGLDAIGNF